VTTAQGLQRITDLHGTMLSGRPRCRAVAGTLLELAISRRQGHARQGGF
jgi:hypothetical protein